ncbi:AbrB/MazE/SpoVT family DNA-binding domain-containing protein [bacterium]|nr:AbrB/MazE/SpoVT family DNA-binding domain-containing protein [bacterium]
MFLAIDKYIQSNYNESMTLKLIQIGNSKGIRIPKALLEQCELQDEVIVEVKDKRMVIYAAGNKRSGWKKEFNRMHSMQDDSLLDENHTQSDWDENEWQW